MSQDSNFNDSIMSMSQDLDLSVNNPPSTMARGRAVTLATMRGVVNLFNHYFKQADEFGNRKKMSRAEKLRRWVSYKQKIWNDYGRRINGAYSSEQALIRRYSDPLTFLKYRLKRTTNLKIEDLSIEDQAYYREIGGSNDVNDLIRRQGNIDSIRSFSQPPNRRRRTEMNSWVPVNVQPLSSSNNIQVTNVASNDYQRNHNVSNQVSNRINQALPPRVTHQSQNPNSTVINLDGNLVSLDANSVKHEVKENEMSQAMDKLNDDLDIFEQEQLLKKKIEAYEITLEKVRAMMHGVKTLLGNEPRMIGLIPGVGSLDDQLILFFDYWLDRCKQAILSEVEKKELFITQIMLFRSDNSEFATFLHKWKMMRIMHSDSFRHVWNWMVDEMNISVKGKGDKNENDVDFQRM